MKIILLVLLSTVFLVILVLSLGKMVAEEEEDLEEREIDKKNKLS